MLFKQWIWISVKVIPPTWWFDEDRSWQKHGAPIPPLTLDHTGCTSYSHDLPASPLFNTISFVMYQTQTSTYCPHICCGRRSLLQWCSGYRPILSWINTRAICRLADTEMFVFQGNPHPSFTPVTPVDPFSLKRKGEKMPRAYNCTRHCDWLRALEVHDIYGVWSVRTRFQSCERNDVEVERKKKNVGL